TKNSGIALRKVEDLLLNSYEFQTTVLRLAGLIGYDRNPRNFLKNRRVVHKINTPVNLVHRDDCVNVIYEIIRNDAWGKVYNVCSDKHPKRTDFYNKEAEIAEIDLPDIEQDSKAEYKIVSNEKLKRELNYSFIYPDPLQLD
ncbi:MAG: SDR family NAD(P)-dependent oxidoreductase, partial [Thermodesulfobacteriota bacterium]